MVTGASTNNVISTIVEVSSNNEVKYNILLPTNSPNGSLNFTKFKISDNQLILMDKSTASGHHILKITATLF